MTRLLLPLLVVGLMAGCKAQTPPRFETVKSSDTISGVFQATATKSQLFIVDFSTEAFCTWIEEAEQLDLVAITWSRKNQQWLVAGGKDGSGDNDSWGAGWDRSLKTAVEKMLEEEKSR